MQWRQTLCRLLLSHRSSRSTVLGEGALAPQAAASQAGVPGESAGPSGRALLTVPEALGPPPCYPSVTPGERRSRPRCGLLVCEAWRQSLVLPRSWTAAQGAPRPLR